jgi:hypothetical protein
VPTELLDFHKLCPVLPAELLVRQGANNVVDTLLKRAADVIPQLVLNLSLLGRGQFVPLDAVLLTDLWPNHLFHDGQVDRVAANLLVGRDGLWLDVESIRLRGIVPKLERDEVAGAAPEVEDQDCVPALRIDVQITLRRVEIEVQLI